MKGFGRVTDTVDGIDRV